MKQLEADSQLFTPTVLFRLFGIYSLVQIASVGLGHGCVCMCFAFSASLLLPPVYVGAPLRGRTATAQPSHPPSPDIYGNRINRYNESTSSQLPSRETCSVCCAGRVCCHFSHILAPYTGSLSVLTDLLTPE